MKRTPQRWLRAHPWTALYLLIFVVAIGAAVTAFEVRDIDKTVERVERTIQTSVEPVCFRGDLKLCREFISATSPGQLRELHRLLHAEFTRRQELRKQGLTPPRRITDAAIGGGDALGKPGG